MGAPRKPIPKRKNRSAETRSGDLGRAGAVSRRGHFLDRRRVGSRRAWHHWSGLGPSPRGERRRECPPNPAPLLLHGAVRSGADEPGGRTGVTWHPFDPDPAIDRNDVADYMSGHGGNGGDGRDYGAYRDPMVEAISRLPSPLPEHYPRTKPPSIGITAPVT
jgi:hypothetical protein